MSAWSSSVTAAVVVVAPLAMRWLLRGSRPAAPGNDFGTIKPDKVFACAGVIVGAVSFIYATTSAFLEASGWWLMGPLCVLTAIWLIGALAPGLTSAQNMSWNHDCVEGPCKNYGFMMGLGKTSISWNNIKCTGETAFGYWFIESVDEKRVYWSFLYRRYGVFAAAIRLHRPDVSLGAKMG